MYNNQFITPFAYNTMPTATQPYGMPMSPYYNMSTQAQATQQQTQPTQQQSNTNAVNTNKIYVTGIEDVKQRYLPPNSDVIFTHNDKPIQYEKIVDATGKMTIKTLSTAECDDNEEKKYELSANYVTRKEFNDLKEEIKNIGLYKSNVEQKKENDNDNI